VRHAVENPRQPTSHYEHYCPNQHIIKLLPLHLYLHFMSVHEQLHELHIEPHPSGTFGLFQAEVTFCVKLGDVDFKNAFLFEACAQLPLDMAQQGDVHILRDHRKIVLIVYFQHGTFPVDLHLLGDVGEVELHVDALECVIVGDWGDVVAVQELLDFWAVVDDLSVEIGAGGGEEKFRHVTCSN
jgi:hypothetical protein